tara:strand:- start:695 stop:1924 length:1230 start_codon:yes stop_codon:yes gene_type:complete
MPTSEKIKERVAARERKLKAENVQAENTNKNNEKKDENATIGKNNRRKNQSGAYSNPLRKIFGGRVMQYPIDLNTDLQDYFEIQIFKYRPAKSLPDITKSNQVGGGTGGYSSKSTQRGNRQNFRLQDLQATIQLPMPPSIKDMNQVDWGSGTMSGLASSVMGPAIAALMGQGERRKELENAIDNEEFKGMKAFAANLMAFTSGTGNAISEGFKGFFSGIQQEDFRRYQFVNAISQAVSGLGVSIEVDQAITRVSGAIRNPNLELLFKNPLLRNFSFTIRLTPRDAEESKRVRMIIRALKQHSAAKVNPQLFEGKTSRDGSNYLLGSPDVFKLRYIKARTQKDIKGLNKFKTCALNSISVDYTGEVGRFAAYEEDSQPVTTIIQLSFTELAPIYDKDYEEFKYTDDDVGM